MLIRLVKSLEKEEVRSIKLFLNRTNAGKDRKDIVLFDYLRKTDEPDEDRIAQKLYGTGKNAYYRLKNRLLEDINKALLSIYGDSNELEHSLQYIILSKLFFRRDEFILAHKYLRRAEKIAEDSNQLEILDMIYSDYIKLSHETLDVNPEKYIEKRRKLSAEIKKIREIDDVLAVLIFRIKSSQNYSQSNLQILNLLQETIDDYSVDPDIHNNPVLRLKIYHSLSRILLQQHDYQSLEKYLEETYKIFEEEKIFKRSNHETKIQMLIYWSNSLFKNGKYEQSLEVAERLSEALNEYDKYLKRKYLFFYVNVTLINTAAIDPEKALVIADQALEDDIIQGNSMHRTFILLNKATLLFDLGNYREGNKFIVRLKLDDAYSKFDDGFKLKISLAEIIFRFELRNYDTVELLIKNVRKDYHDLLEEESYRRQKMVLDVIELMMITHNIKGSDAIMERIRELLGIIPDEAGFENDVINYNTWLKSKIQ